MNKKIFLGILLSFLFSCVNVKVNLMTCNPKASEQEVFVDFQETDYQPTNNNIDPLEIESVYGYKGFKNSYQIETYYYSQVYDVLYVAYKNVASLITRTTDLSSDDLEDMEIYLLNNFGSDDRRLEYLIQLKIIRLYPDSNDVACGNYSLGCTGILPQNTYIDLYRVNKNNIYNFLDREPVMETLVHEYGHLFTSYHLFKEGNVSMEEYLKIRLGSQYLKLFPKGIPSSYDTNDEYYLYPNEIVADDYVELFTSYPNYNRLSLSNNSELQYLKNNQDIVDNLKNLYQAILNKNIAKFEQPISITSACNGCKFTYYTSKTLSEKIVINTKYKINLISDLAVKLTGTWYYRVIITSLIDGEQNYLNQIATRMGYVEAKYFIESNYRIYQLNHDIEILSGGICEYLSKCNTSNSLNYYLDNGYPFSYFIDLDTTNDKIDTPDYYYAKKYNVVSMPDGYFITMNKI